MAWDECDATFQIISIHHGAEELSGPIAFNLQEEIEFLPIRYGTILGPICRPMVARDCAAVGTCLEIDDDIEADVKASLVCLLKQADGGTTSITATNMKRGSMSIDARVPPFSRSVDFLVEDSLENSNVVISY